MSAYVVDKLHIDALVTWAGMRPDMYYWNGEECVPFAGNENLIGQKLLDQNVRSVAQLYSIPDNDPEAQSYRYDWQPFGPARTMTAVEVIKACKGLAYQCDDSEDFEATDAARILDRIINQAISELPGYDEAKTWEITPRTKFANGRPALAQRR